MHSIVQFPSYHRHREYTQDHLKVDESPVFLYRKRIAQCTRSFLNGLERDVPLQMHVGLPQKKERLVIPAEDQNMLYLLC